MSVLDNLTPDGTVVVIATSLVGATAWVLTQISTLRKELSTKAEADLSTVYRAIDDLRTHSVRRDEVSALEGRLTAFIDKIEAQVTRIGERMETLSAIEANSRSNGAELARLIARLEAKGVI